MKSEIREFIDPMLYDTIPKMMNRALSREQELQRRAAETAGKHKVEQPPLSSHQPPPKKQRFGQGSQQQQQQRCQQPQQQGRGVVRDIPTCNTCSRRHYGECRLGSDACYRCGKPGHLAANCPSPYKLCHYCLKDDHLKANCPKLKDDIRRAEQRKEAEAKANAGGSRTKTRVFPITTEEAKESHDVVTGTFVVNSMSAHVLFDSGATKSFVSFSFGKQFNVPLS